jgi:hypothetical protein
MDILSALSLFRQPPSFNRKRDSYLFVGHSAREYRLTFQLYHNGRENQGGRKKTGGVAGLPSETTFFGSTYTFIVCIPTYAANWFLLLKLQ